MSATIYMCGPGGAREIANVDNVDQATSYVIRFLALNHYSRVRNPGPGLFVAKKLGYKPDMFFVYDPEIFEERGRNESHTGPVILSRGMLMPGNDVRP